MNRLLIAALCFVVGSLAASAVARWAEPGVLVSVDAVEIERLPLPSSSTLEPPRYLFDSLEADEGFAVWFVPRDNGQMKEIWAVALDTYADDCCTNTLRLEAGLLNVLPNGDLNDRDDFEATQLSYEGRRFTFTTNTIRGVRYEFDGEFTRPGRYFIPEETVLRGTMRKFRKGELIAAFTSDFAYREPVCLH